jgi:LmbE family N-acetylglucosaminyl deacetylase
VRTLLAVHAHPDDETLTTGGTLARYSAAGVRTIVVTCTLGDLGEVPPSLRAREPNVAVLRDRELDAAIRTRAAVDFLMRMPPALAATLWHDEYYSLESALEHDVNVADDLFAGLDE